jgi:hypothetical protein
MSTWYDEKGKFYTEVVAKDTVAAIIQTITHLVRGDVYIRPGRRLKDELNQNEQFLAVTNASVFSLQGELIFRSKFLTVNRTQVIWVTPENELLPAEPDAGGRD